jgi:mycothiol synthase
VTAELPAPSIRRLRGDDMDALGDFIRRAVGRGDLAGSSEPRAIFMLEMLRLAPSETAIATRATPAGESIVGFVQPEHKAIVVEPVARRQGIGRSLVAAGLEIERERGRARLLMGPPPGEAVALEFLRETGFTLHSTLWDLRLPAGSSVEDPGWPVGAVVRPFDRTRDVEGFIALFNAAFADHPTPLVMTEELVRAGFDDPRVVDADTIVVESPEGSLVGFCATEPERTDDGIASAEVWVIGVTESQRGRGLGRALLDWGVGYLRSLGGGDVTLSVNGRNDGALRLYERAGFGRVGSRQRWGRPVPPP